jgi:hypothetical protein
VELQHAVGEAQTQLGHEITELGAAKDELDRVTKEALAPQGK